MRAIEPQVEARCKRDTDTARPWRQVVEYFDAFIIGLTATPSKQTLKWLFVLAEEVVVGSVRHEDLLTYVRGGRAAGSRSRSPVGV